MKLKITLSALAIVTCLFLPLASLQASDGGSYASYWKCSDGNTYGLTANGSKRALYLPTRQAPIFFSGVKDGNSYRGTIFLGNQRISVSGPISNNSTRVTLYSSDGRTWVLNFAHK